MKRESFDQIMRIISIISFVIALINLTKNIVSKGLSGMLSDPLFVASLIVPAIYYSYILYGKYMKEKTKQKATIPQLLLCISVFIIATGIYFKVFSDYINKPYKIVILPLMFNLFPIAYMLSMILLKLISPFYARFFAIPVVIVGNLIGVGGAIAVLVGCVDMYGIFWGGILGILAGMLVGGLVAFVPLQVGMGVAEILCDNKQK